MRHEPPDEVDISAQAVELRGQHKPLRAAAMVAASWGASPAPLPEPISASVGCSSIVPRSISDYSDSEQHVRRYCALILLSV
jgi:hypothetical protein